MISRDAPDVVAEVAALFDDYERALVDGDLAALTNSFDDGEGVIRFGINDAQRGAAQLAQWRAAQPALPEGRTLRDTVVATYGSDTAIVTTLFTYPGRAKVGRQSQIWFRDEGRWRIVHAHVSEIDETTD